VAVAGKDVYVFGGATKGRWTNKVPLTHPPSLRTVPLFSCVGVYVGVGAHTHTQAHTQAFRFDTQRLEWHELASMTSGLPPPAPAFSLSLVCVRALSLSFLAPHIHPCLSGDEFSTNQQA